MDGRLHNWINWILYDELMEGKINAPKHLLGIHDFGDGQVITCYKPHSSGVSVKTPTGKTLTPMEKIGEDGFYGLFFPKKKIKGNKYRFVTDYYDGTSVETADCYSFEGLITDYDAYLFAEGKNYDIYNKMGAHPMTIDGVKGTYFAVWAPDARRVSVVGDFNMWDGALNPMQIHPASGIYELFIPDVMPGAVYKYQILTRFGDILYKADPYGNQDQVRPDNANIVADLTYTWKDNEWIEKRKKIGRVDRIKQPMSIYECHLGSWKKKIEDSDFGFYNYRELAQMLGDYITEMGYTHIELMGIAEYPFDGSWGYQVTNYFAPTSRYGTPADFMYFVDEMHKRGIGVILDWVPAHFPRDAHGLGRFDGMALYENADPRKGEHPDWGTYIFDYGRNEVINFLTSNALFWVEKYHIDGLRVDAVASMLYLDYGKRDGEWVANKDGGKENLEAIALLQTINKVMEERNPGAYLIAEESTAWPGVTAPADMKGLGFLFKWNMGWMNDFLEYMKLDPYFRKFNHNRLTFSLSYTYSENYILVISHDEVVHLKCSMLNKMSGLEFDKFANLRTAYGFMCGHPGKKLLFMGQEFAQLREWSEARSLDWYLLDDPMHKGMQDFVKDLNHIYTKYDALYYNDNDVMGFEWTKVDDAESGIVAFVRRGKTAKDQLLFICNFVPVARKDYRVGVPCLTTYKELISSDDPKYGGLGRNKTKSVKAENVPCDRSKQSIVLDVPPLSVTVMKYDFKESAK